jgi:ketosteroid isomerase-like protein
VWRSQHLNGAEVVVVGDTAVLCAEVIDTIRSGADAVEMFRMPITQVWVRQGDAWKCLAGHVGPHRNLTVRALLPDIRDPRGHADVRACPVGRMSR